MKKRACILYNFQLLCNMYAIIYSWSVGGHLFQLSSVAELSIHFKILNFFEMKHLRFRIEEINVMNIHITTGSLSVPSSG